MRKINLFNRDGANMFLEEIKKISPNIYEFQITVDNDHKYVLEYCRAIYEEGFGSKIIAIDPAGGPFLPLEGELKDELDNKIFKIIEINSAKSILLSERDNNN